MHGEVRVSQKLRTVQKIKNCKKKGELLRFSPSLPVDPLFKRRKGLRNNEQKLATMSSRFLELDLCILCRDAFHTLFE